MVNSIRDNLDEIDTISEIRLLLPVQKEYTFILVEGVDDLQLFRPLLSEKVELIKSYGSKNGIEKIVGQHFKHNKRIIGIRDRDYAKKPCSKRMFFCDYCCSEMMIISNIEAFNKIYSNFYTGTMSPADLLLYCLKYLEYLSRIRKLNEEKNWKIRLDGIKANKLYNSNISIMNQNIISEINRQNPSNQLDAVKILMINKQPSCSTLIDFLKITNGHDFVHIFSKLCNNWGFKYIEHSLRCAYSLEEFADSQLYKDLQQYEKTHHLSIL